MGDGKRAKIAVITGAAQGILQADRGMEVGSRCGRGIARLFASGGGHSTIFSVSNLVGDDESGKFRSSDDGLRDAGVG